MFEAIRQFFSDLATRNRTVDLAEDDVRLAIAGLLAHVVAIDGVVSEEERKTLAGLLQDRFGVDTEGARSLAEAGVGADAAAVDLYGFTSVLKRRLSDAERERIVEMMWRLVYADGKVHEFEDNLIWRVAELLGVPAQVRIGLKQAVRGDVG